MIFGEPSFQAQQEDKLFKIITEGKLNIPENFYDNVLKDLLEKIIVVDPNKRLGCLRRGIRDIKDHQWFNGFDWGGLFRKRIEVPWIPYIKNELDHSNFSCDEPDDPGNPYVDDGSGWDKDF